MRSIIAPLVLAIVATAGCGTPFSDAEEKAALEQGATLADASFKALSYRLQQAMKEGGPAHAVDFCSLNALSIVDSLSNAHGAHIRRTSDRADRFDAGGGPADAPVSVRARPAADAVAQQAELVPGVISAAARVLSDAPPTIELRLIVDDGYDLTALTGRIDERVRAGLRRTLGRPDAALILRIGLKHAKTGVVDGGTLVAPTASARAIVAPGKVPQITLTQAILPVPALPQPAGWPGGSRPSDHSAESSAATSSGTSTLA